MRGGASDAPVVPALSDIRAVSSGLCAHCGGLPSRYLIWIGSDQEKTFGPTISGLIHKHIGPERMCLWDSKARGTFLLAKTALGRTRLVAHTSLSILSQADGQT